MGQLGTLVNCGQCSQWLTEVVNCGGCSHWLTTGSLFIG